MSLSLYKARTYCFKTKDHIRFIFGFAKATSLSLRLPERFSQIGFAPNKTQCALYGFDPESGESQQLWLSYIVKFWICSNLTLPGNPFKLKPEKGFAQTLSCPFCQVSHCSNVSLPSVYSHRGQTEISSWISHEGSWSQQSRHSPFTTLSQNTEPVFCVSQY